MAPPTIHNVHEVFKMSFYAYLLTLPLFYDNRTLNQA